MSARLTGVAHFIPQHDGLLYREHGILRRGAEGWDASQTYLFKIDGNRAEVQFANGRLFHTIVMSSGRADVMHECAPDRYRGRYGIRHQNCWMLGWRIDGPRKHMLIATRYEREVVA